MNDGVRGIRREVARLKHDRRPTAVRYPLALRRRITALARRRRAHGAGLATIARELGLAEWTLNLWLRKTSAPVLRAVEIVPAPPASAITTPVLITPHRSQEAARQVLNGYRGIVVADGYGAYDALARAGPSFTLAHCWAHVRRKFVDAEDHYPEPCGEVLALIGQLYAVEHACPAVAIGMGEDLRAEARARRATARREQSAPIIAAIHAWAHQQRVLPESSVGKAIAYMLGLWPGLTRFLDDPRIALDNNATERALRGMVIGRKNHYGSRSKRGTEVAGLFYSLIESAKLCGVEPKAYLLSATHAALHTPGTVTLPHALLTS
jgi:transposase